MKFGSIILLGLCHLACSQPVGILEIRILDGAEATPARLEILDADGRPWIAPDALGLTIECLSSPPPDWLEATVLTTELYNPYTATTQFYAAGRTSLELPAGNYRVRVYKGNEYKVATREIEIEAGRLIFAIPTSFTKNFGNNPRNWVVSADSLTSARGRPMMAWRSARQRGGYRSSRCCNSNFSATRSGTKC